MLERLVGGRLVPKKYIASWSELLMVMVKITLINYLKKKNK